VQRSRGLVEVPKAEKSSIVEEKTGGRRSRSSGTGTSEGLSRENKDLREVAKSGFILDHWIQRTHGRDPHSSGKSRREYPRGGLTKSKLMKSITTVDRQRNVDRRSGPEEFTDSEIGKGRRKELTKVPKRGVAKGVGPQT
jgi:hypothetical protein